MKKMGEKAGSALSLHEQAADGGWILLLKEPFIPLPRNQSSLYAITADQNIQVSVQFGAFHYARRQFEARNTAQGSSSSSCSPSSYISPTHTQPQNTGKPALLSYTQLYASGAFAGLSNAYLSGPIEHVRIRLQTQPHGAARLYSGPLDCVRKLARHGALFRGQTVTLLREAQAYGVWFLTFEYLMRRHTSTTQQKRSDIPAPMIALYGGLAGEALWLSSYPLDVVKSKMQSDGFLPGDRRRYATMRDCFGQTWREEGMRGFWRGVGPTMVRALPVSAGTFIV
ncbi:MAG: hypothetical protein Q9220_004902 [cf. Caloplaca sp. 1 TL-2023]